MSCSHTVFHRHLSHPAVGGPKFAPTPTSRSRGDVMESAFILPTAVQSTAFLVERAAVNDAAYLQPDDSALCALTDFRHEHPITVHADSLVGNALRDMNQRSVHALLVTREEDSGIGQQVVGMITHFDIERRHPHRHRYGNGTFSSRFSRLRVAEVMAPCDELSLVKYQSLQSLTASELYEMFQGTGLTHLLVVESLGNGSTLARGLLSRASLTVRLHRARPVPCGEPGYHAARSAFVSCTR